MPSENARNAYRRMLEQGGVKQISNEDLDRFIRHRRRVIITWTIGLLAFVAIGTYIVIQTFLR